MKRYQNDDYYFILNRCKTEDRGEYIIRAENSYGFREEPVFLNVQGTFLFFHRNNSYNLLLYSVGIEETSSLALILTGAWKKNNS